MPDLINPEYNQGKKEFRVWVDELCKSCLVQDCPLFAVLSEHTIMTMSGMHVTSCELYDPDEDSDYYVAPDASVETVREINMMQIEQRLQILTDNLEGFDANSIS